MVPAGQKVPTTSNPRSTTGIAVKVVTSGSEERTHDADLCLHCGHQHHWVGPHNNTQTHKYTNTQIHKYTNTQIHKYTNTQIHKYKIHKYTSGSLQPRRPAEQPHRLIALEWVCAIQCRIHCSGVAIQHIFCKVKI